MITFAFLVNVVHMSLLAYVILHILRKKQDSSLLWLLISLMYFVDIPLFFDSLESLVNGSYKWETTVIEYNTWSEGSWERGFINKYLLDLSIKALFFDLFIILSYNIVIGKNKKYNILEYNRSSIENSFFSWSVCYGISYIGFLLFLINYSLIGGSILAGNKIVNLLQGICITIAPLGLIKGFFQKQYLLGIGTILPVITVALMFEARARVISLAFVLLYFYLWKNSNTKFGWKNLLTLILIAFGGSLLLTALKGADGVSYPFVKDVSYIHLFYFYEHLDSVSTNGTNFLRLLLTGINSIEVEDITFKLADYKIFVGWGSLHPTMLGWALVDLKGMYWLLAIWAGLFLGFSDRLRRKLPKKYNLLYMSLIFVFVSVAARGSVQYAYAAIVYPFFLVIFYSLCKKFKIQKYENISNS